MAGDVRPISAGAISGTDTISLDDKLFGGVDLNADGTNAATCVIRDENASGTILIDTSTITGKTIIAPFKAPSGIIHYVISGTNADAMLYEWVE